MTEEMSYARQITASKILSQALKKCLKCVAQNDIPQQARALGAKLLEALNKCFSLVEENHMFADVTLLD